MNIKTIVAPEKFKTSYLAQGPKRLSFFYDDEADELMLMLANPEDEAVVHYLDNHVGILFDPESFEIVGLQIEGFKKGFVPKYVSLEKAWKLSDFGDINRADVGELSVIIEEKQLQVALAVVKAAGPILGQTATPFERALEYA